MKIEDNIGTVDYFGEHRKVFMDTDGAKEGDYVYAQGGVLIRTVPEKEALETLEFWKERFFELKKVDARLSKVHDSQTSNAILAILQKVNLKRALTKEDMSALYKVTKPEELKLIYETANSTRQKENDNACCVHGILEFSNHCRNDCSYCGIRKSSSIKRYRMTVDEIIKNAEYAVKELGFKALVLQSGEDTWYDEKKLVEIVRRIRKMGVLIFISIGARSKELYRKVYEAGARAVLLRFETSNREIFENLRPGTSFEERIDLIKYVKSLGYVVATGFIVGLPGETDNDLINNILLTKSLGADMHSFGPLIPAEGTPLEDERLPDKQKVLKTIAISRFADREAKILVTTALETLDRKTRKEGLLAGANSIMINVTPPEYRELYIIYPNRADKDKDIKENIKQTTDLLYSIGRAPTDIGL
ncbi:MAG: radical SAM protein [Nanoarchaeota archaeon]|nr:radical SAM protein [Nanoarchaeota archaeon]